MDLAEGLRQVADAGAPAQAQRAQELIAALDRQTPTPDTTTVHAAEELVRAFLHDPDLWR